jgi:hypothetical protein
MNPIELVSKFKYEFKLQEIGKGFPFELGSLGCNPTRPTAHSAHAAYRTEPTVARRGLPSAHVARGQPTGAAVLVARTCSWRAARAHRQHGAAGGGGLTSDEVRIRRFPILWRTHAAMRTGPRHTK